jgi:hypothetical protein
MLLDQKTAIIYGAGGAIGLRAEWMILVDGEITCDSNG